MIFGQSPGETWDHLVTFLQPLLVGVVVVVIIAGFFALLALLFNWYDPRPEPRWYRGLRASALVVVGTAAVWLIGMIVLYVQEYGPR